MASQQSEPLNHGHFAPQGDTLYDSTYDSHSSPYDHVSPTSFDPRHSSPDPPQQYADYPLYSAPEDQKPQGLFAYDPPNSTSGSINPADLSLMSGGQHPHQEEHQSHHGTPQLEIKPYHSPGLHHQQDSSNYLSASSTQPSATGFEWDTIVSQAPTWSGHRRTPSEYSDISSAAPSPYLQNQEFNEQPSPLLQGQHLSHQGSMQDLLNGPGEAFGLESFSLHDREHTPSLSHTPVIQSGANSPFLMAQSEQHMMMIPPLHGMHPPPPPNAPAGHGAGMPPRSEPGEYPSMQVPQIDVIFAPPQRQPTFPGRPGMAADDSALSPPPKSPQRRQRAKSDPYADRNNLTVGTSGPGSISPAGGRSRRNSLSPVDIVTAPVGSQSRSPSPSSKANRRSSTNSIPNNRDYILELAHPNRPGATAGDNKRVQKHPATFQCHLCPKRFTRAYNLRSHLRTHTDERPFVCTICGKAFARQHDRKRHEGLHSGEKKFVCRGNLKAGGVWGCGRRFARADALGRHFRSEAGRVCIRPLLDEETAERQRNQVLMDHASMFPSAILEQYPALATVNWAMVPPDGGGDESGRSSFDASGGEGYESYGDGSGWGSDNGGGGGDMYQ